VAISAFFHKIQFSLQHGQQITLVVGHWNYPAQAWLRPRGAK
jgi:hypothetical protein